MRGEGTARGTPLPLASPRRGRVPAGVTPTVRGPLFRIGRERRRWRDHPRGEGHTVTGNVKVLRGVRSPQLGNRRDLLVYLPPGHGEGDLRFPVVYMHDGQNLFDQASAFTREWEIDETMEAASARGFQAIVVGIPNAGPDRLREYTPWPDPKHGGGDGERYLDFVVETVKPLVDRDFRTLTGREETGIAGSSLGGLISLHAFFTRRDTFGFAGVMSPSLWYAGGRVMKDLPAMETPPGRIYLDVGMAEGGDHVLNARRLLQDLVDKGYRKGRDLLYVEERDAAHAEEAWARRWQKALYFLLRGARARPGAAG
jgi:predicted alpha/beta superfamily hydrolase